MNPFSSSSPSILRSFRAGRVDGVVYAANYHREIEDFEPLHHASVHGETASPGRADARCIPDEERGGHNVGVL